MCPFWHLLGPILVPFLTHKWPWEPQNAGGNQPKWDFFEPSRADPQQGGRHWAAQSAPSETRQNQKVSDGGPQGVAQGAENAFFCKKWSLFDFRPHNSPLLDEIRGVLGGFAKKCFKTIFFVRFFFDFCRFFASAGGWPRTALHCRGAQPLLSRFRTCQKMSKKCQKIYFFYFFFRLQMGSSGL